MSLRARASGWLRSNIVVRALNAALDGNLIGEYALTALFGAALIVCWSFALVRSNALLRGPSEGGRAHNPAIGGSTPPSATNLTRLNVRASDASQLEKSGPFTAPSAPRWSARSEQNTGRPASDPHRTVGVTAGRDRLIKIVTTAAVSRGVPGHILAGLAEDESSWRPAVAGKDGEVGLLQLKSSVAAWCGIKDRRNPVQNADCGARYLASMFDRFATWELAIVAFKAGPEAIPDSIPASSWAYAQRALLKAEAYR